MIKGQAIIDSYVLSETAQHILAEFARNPAYLHSEKEGLSAVAWGQLASARKVVFLPNEIFENREQAGPVVNPDRPIDARLFGNMANGVRADIAQIASIKLTKMSDNQAVGLIGKPQAGRLPSAVILVGQENLNDMGENPGGLVNEALILRRTSRHYEDGRALLADVLGLDKAAFGKLATTRTQEIPTAEVADFLDIYAVVQATKDTQREQSMLDPFSAELKFTSVFNEAAYIFTELGGDIKAVTMVKGALWYKSLQTGYMDDTLTDDNEFKVDGIDVPFVPGRENARFKLFKYEPKGEVNADSAFDTGKTFRQLRDALATIIIKEMDEFSLRDMGNVSENRLLAPTYPYTGTTQELMSIDNAGIRELIKIDIPTTPGNPDDKSVFHDFDRTLRALHVFMESDFYRNPPDGHTDGYEAVRDMAGYVLHSMLRGLDGLAPKVMSSVFDKGYRGTSPDRAAYFKGLHDLKAKDNPKASGGPFKADEPDTADDTAIAEPPRPKSVRKKKPKAPENEGQK